MGSNYKNNGGGKCGCNKRVKKAQRVPQRGPGVAELEKILSDQKQDHMKPTLYTTNLNGASSFYNQPPHYHHHHLLRPITQPMMPLPRPLSESTYFDDSYNVKPWRSDVVMKSNSSNYSELSFTQMMMSSNDTQDNSNTYVMNKKPSQMIVANSKSIDEHEKIMLRNILTLGPPSPTEVPDAKLLNPILIDSDSSEKQCKDKKKPNQSQIFGFNLAADDTKLSLQHNAARVEELSLDLTLKL